MKWKVGCTNHPKQSKPTNVKYHPIRGQICSICGRKITLLEGTTVNK